MWRCQVHRLRPNRRLIVHIFCGLGTLNYFRDTVFVGGEDVEVEDMVGIVLATPVGLLIVELAFFEVAEETVVGHHVSRIEGTLDGL